MQPSCHAGRLWKFSANRFTMQRKLLAALGMTMLLLAGLSVANAARITERSKQKLIAETERSALRQKLAALKRDINQTEAAKGHAADSLAHSETAISDANRSLRDLADEQKQTADRLTALSKQQIELTKTVDAQHQQLARLLREQYVAGNEDRIKLLLSGDNPNRINRDLQYMGYVSQAQARLLESLRANLQAVEKNKADTQNAQEELDEIAQEAQAQKALLEKEKGKRATLLAQLSNKLVIQRKEAGNIARDDQRLASLVDKLSRLIEEQRKAELAEANRRRQQAAHDKAQRQKQQTAKAKNHAKNAPIAAQGSPDTIDADENPSKVIARNELAPVADVQNGAFPN